MTSKHLDDLFLYRDDIKLILCDANHLLGNGRLISSMTSAAAFCVLYLGGCRPMERTEETALLYRSELPHCYKSNVSTAEQDQSWQIAAENEPDNKVSDETDLVFFGCDKPYHSNRSNI